MREYSTSRLDSAEVGVKHQSINKPLYLDRDVIPS
jgi:hypothetical protein